MALLLIEFSNLRNECLGHTFPFLEKYVQRERIMIKVMP